MDNNTMKKQARSKIQTEDKESNVDAVLINLSGNLYGCDLMFCLFLAALQSYRVDSCLRPFPPAYIKNTYKDVERLRSICDNVPPFETILKSPQMCSDEIHEILDWLFCHKDQPSLIKVNLNKVNVPTKLQQSFCPDYTYEVVYPSKVEEMWQKRQNSRGTFLAYHGSKLENFYSIFKVGLQHHMSTDKTLLFGNGIYVTTEITISMPYAQYGQSWVHSKLGNRISIIAVCEVINDVEKVKCKGNKPYVTSSESISQNIPDKYFVITDSEMIRLKYLFVYKDNTSNVVQSWILKNLTLVLICLYILILFCIGFFQGPTWPKIRRHIKNILYSDV